MTDKSDKGVLDEMQRESVRIATQFMPKEVDLRRAPIDRIIHKVEEEKAAVKAAKEEVGLSDAMTSATDAHGWNKSVIQILVKLDKMSSGDRTAWIAQFAIGIVDRGFTEKDLVDLAFQAKAEAGSADTQGSIFDKTTAAARQGVADTDPNHVRPADAPPEGKPTTGIALDEALKRYEAAQAAFEGKKGRKPKELVEAKKAYETLKAEHESEPDPVGQMNGTADAGEAHIRSQIEGKAFDLDEDEPPAIDPKNPLSDVTGNANYTMQA